MQGYFPQACEGPDICDEEWVLNEHGELLANTDAVKMIAEVNNELINKANKKDISHCL